MVVKTSKTTGKSESYFESVGRRKESVARARIFLKPATVKSVSLSKGDILVNGKALKDSFSSVTDVAVIKKPLTLLEAEDRYAISISVVGGGVSGQKDAIAHAISMALIKVDSTYRPTLKAAGLLTRDPRIKERRKVGTGGKARRQKQSPKR